MKSIKEMTLGELAAYVCSHLRENGINVVLSGGACVSIYTKNKYQSYDLDFIENISSTRKKLKQVMEIIGFTEDHRYYKHPDTKFFVEFPPGPVTVGDEPAEKPNELSFNTGKLTLLSATDCIKDRLAGYFHWHDKQCLEQASLVAKSNQIELGKIKQWSEHEGKLDEFLKIKRLLTKE